MISLMVVPSSYTNHARRGQFFAGACTVGAVLLGEGRAYSPERPAIAKRFCLVL